MNNQDKIDEYNSIRNDLINYFNLSDKKKLKYLQENEILLKKKKIYV